MITVDLPEKAPILEPDVSIIIPTHNRLSMLLEALESVFSQTFDGTVEVIVIDDYSDDGTAEVVSQKYSNVRLISLTQNLGAYGARNVGLQNAKGRYIGFLDTDDLWESNYLDTQMTALKGKEKCFAVSAVVHWNTIENFKFISLQKPDLEKYTSPLHHLLVTYSFISTPSSVIFPRKVFDEIGLFSNIRVSGDAEFYLRSLIAKYSPVFSEQPLVIKRFHDQGHLFDPKKIDLVREGIRLLRIKKFYPVIQEHFTIVSLSEIFREFHQNSAARRYLKKDDLKNWFLATVLIFKTYPKYAFFSLRHDFKLVLKKIKWKLSLKVKRKMTVVFKNIRQNN